MLLENEILDLKRSSGTELAANINLGTQKRGSTRGGGVSKRGKDVALGSETWAKKSLAAAKLRAERGT
jgi:hypothetical protein